MSKLDYLQVKNLTETSADIYFYGDIVGDEWEVFVLQKSQ